MCSSETQISSPCTHTYAHTHTEWLFACGQHILHINTVTSRPSTSAVSNIHQRAHKHPHAHRLPPPGVTTVSSLLRRFRWFWSERIKKQRRPALIPTDGWREETSCTRADPQAACCHLLDAGSCCVMWTGRLGLISGDERRCQQMGTGVYAGPHGGELG